VTADGKVWDGLRGLRKDNTGYDLRNLFIGAEGTLGIITAAVLKLYPQPRAVLTALAGVDSPQHALRLLGHAQDRCGANLTGFELMSDYCLDLVAAQFPQLGRPLAARHAYAVLLELSSNESDAHAAQLLESTLDGIADDAVIASSVAQASTLWQIREHIPLAQAKAGKNIKHDISVPVSRIGAFIETTAAQLQADFPGSRLVCFGHLGDGNLHYNVEAPLERQAAVNRVVHDSVAAHGGSISAEHGIGALKTGELARYKPAVELDMMRAIKRALDPHNIMNPGKILA
jgi:FAD/FMN-containing dehydrogenase